MNDSRFQLAAYHYAKKKGVDPSSLTDVDYLKIGMSIRSPGRLVKDGVKALASRISVTVRRVPLPIFSERRERCQKNTCGHMIVSADNNIVCGKCGCSGEWMLAALNDPSESCRLPAGDKLWDVYIDEARNGL